MDCSPSGFSDHGIFQARILEWDAKASSRRCSQSMIEPMSPALADGFFTIAAKSLQSCPTLCNPIDGSPPGSPIPGILQTRTLEWVAISFSNAWKWIVKLKSLSCIWLLVTPWTAAYQAPPSMGFSRQETPGVTGQFGLGIWNETGQRLIEFCQENTLVIANTLFQQHRRRLHMDITRWSRPKSDWLYSL